MSTVSTATVETLTAEVRVLMVGSRQVTLSVYRQLDHFQLGRPLSEFEPFGRISSGTKYAEADYWDRTVKRTPLFEFVGRDNTSGALVRLVLLASNASEDIHGAEVLAQIRKWDTELPLIVLAGLR